MHILFAHPNYPAQFGHIAARLVKDHGFRCTFVSEKPPGLFDGVERIQYRPRGGATRKTHYCSRTSENATWAAFALFQALLRRADIRPDLVVAHSGFFSTVFLRELYDCPIINYFEYFYAKEGGDLDYRPESPPGQLDRLRARARNATLLLDLENCDLGYSPTRWQRDRLPAPFHDKVRVLFDGIDTSLWRPHLNAPRQIAGQTIPAEMRIVTYVSRGMERMRGFDIFMRTSKLLCDRRRDILFVVVGQDRICYGNDEMPGYRSFKEWVLAQDDYDLSRFVFTGRLPREELAALLSLPDLHIYLTVPFVLSWSLFNALACGAPVLASDTGPVREVICHGKNGLLADFFDPEGLAETADAVLDAPKEYRHLGRAGVEVVQERYSLDVCLPQMIALYEDAGARAQAAAHSYEIPSSRRLSS